MLRPKQDWRTTEVNWDIWRADAHFNNLVQLTDAPGNETGRAVELEPAPGRVVLDGAEWALAIVECAAALPPGRGRAALTAAGHRPPKLRHDHHIETVRKSRNGVPVDRLLIVSYEVTILAI